MEPDTIILSNGTQIGDTNAVLSSGNYLWIFQYVCLNCIQHGTEETNNGNKVAILRKEFRWHGWGRWNNGAGGDKYLGHGIIG